jgi:pyrroline-5-carboxylate reductase
MKILVIGAGNMGTTYAQSFLRSHVATREQMMLLIRDKGKLEVTQNKGIGTVHTSAEDCLASADMIIISVKPQDSQALFEQIKPYVDPQQVFLSVMAGVKISTICESLGVKKVIRAMPNLPSQIGKGMTAFTSTEEVTRIELVMVQNLLSTTGKVLYLEQESLIDAATAISGSGPAYVYYFMDAMTKAAMEMGFSQSEAELLVGQTFLGAVDLFSNQDLSCEEWIKKVASRGGTTEAALKQFNALEVKEGIREGAFAALLRARELGG